MPRPTLSVPKPCHESWQAMTPATQGRHCAACDKVVVDFTRMSDAELLAHLGQPKGSGSTCGRFRASQLERPLLPAAPAPYYSRLMAAVLAFAGVGAAVAPAAAQLRPSTPVEQRRITMGMMAAAPAPHLALLPVVVRGIVLDSATQEPLPGVTVLVQGTTTGVSTGSDGKFELQLPASTEPAGLVEVQVSSVGYVSQLLTLRSAALH
ncbi:carboxypeptidase-like regulatory domain-containing protein [Hymenobacter sublimis]|uniref:Carboxypeptidase-like regulatory domain-containing protein n=1 Tax=Hymenobacter sublimis TaxID=2933777 RepID=A0ABY4J9R8_9BACT|nr:carboxypeptidase-like regulatory domain-containing protein [Hymenobacter sublimis]UPL49171.1 carboxypeptidase-like regulatory domain-containing protein [Hymenobacter sublimis]